MKLQTRLRQAPLVARTRLKFIFRRDLSQIRRPVIYGVRKFFVAARRRRAQAQGDKSNVAGGTTVVVGHLVFVPLVLLGSDELWHRQKNYCLVQDR
jgi:hypothetical protein